MPNKKKSELMDNQCIQIVGSNVNMCVPWYIMAAYAYYVDDQPLLEDHTFDRLATKILNNWDDIEHFHKHFLNKDMLTAGTYLGEYPSRVKDAVVALRGF